MAKQDISILLENCTPEELQTRRDLPTDTHLVRLKKPTWKKKEQVMAVRAYDKVGVFDHFHDQGFIVLEISNGFGTHKPKLWNGLDN